MTSEIGINPAQLDSDPVLLRDAFFQLGARSLLGLKGAREWGGVQLPREVFFQFQETVARYSGALAFLQTQHQSAVSKLASCPNQDLKERFLADATQGKTGLGVGFSQLRRSGSPLVKAIPVEGGYQVSGEVPWVTGYGCFQFFILGAVLPDQHVIFGLLPFSDRRQDSGGSLTVSQPMELAAMRSTNTVKVHLDNWFMADSEVLDLKPADWIHQSDRHNALNHSFFALGCARAGLDVVHRATDQADTSTSIGATWDALDQQLTHCREAIYQAQYQVGIKEPEEGLGDRLRFRAEAIDLAVRCAHAAVVVSRGAANALSHPAQRIYREALAFSVFGQTTAVMDATLAQIIKSSR
ncbi:MAG: acyl-CoA dehydrogenase [Merismopedia sp. SIO2A8]|nr:acyl-CoA dehydrogenase [Symploca sp. SIO2B6]NET48427.1 acyl-CoA dehydrogenase [Merismopedia sp. SIO2A8]